MEVEGKSDSDDLSAKSSQQIEKKVETSAKPKENTRHGSKSLNSNASEEQTSKKMENSSEGIKVQGTDEKTHPSIIASEAPRRPGRRRRGQIYDKNDDPETIKEKRMKRAVELKLKNLKWTLNQPSDVSGKRQKKAPQRFELVPVDKRKSCMDNCEGFGECLGNLPWIHQQLQSASIYTLRLLHRTIYRKQGMFSEKLIRKTVGKFSGFPFDGTHPEVTKRREQLEKANISSLGNLCDLLALRRGSKDVMVDRVIGFLLKPSQESVDEYLKVVMTEKLQQSKNNVGKAMCSSMRVIQDPFQPLLLCQADEEGKDTSHDEENSEVNDVPWKKPVFYIEGSGVKLKFIRAIVSNIHAASDPFIEVLHRLLYLNVDEKNNMRRSILEFSGFKCDVGSTQYIYRMRILASLPSDQLKIICRVLCLPTWHKSRQLLTEAIMDFLAAPRISVMKKRVPPHFTDEITFSFDGIKSNKAPLPELKSAESEEIEIIPDIHIPDEASSNQESDLTVDNEYLGVKLKHFSNIHYQVISTPAAKLNDVHMILYLTTSAQNNIRRNVLEFSGYHFDESSSEYQCRRNLMEQMSVEDLKTVATVLCVSQYIVDESKNSLMEAILKFLLKPSALLSSSTIMPTISPAPSSRKSCVVKKKATSTSKTSLLGEIMPDIKISKVETLSNAKDATIQPINNAITCTSTTIHDDIKPDIEKVKAVLSNSIQILPLPSPSPDVKITPITPIISKFVPILPAPIKTEDGIETDEPLSKVKNTVFKRPKSNAEICREYRKRKKDKNKISKDLKKIKKDLKKRVKKQNNAKHCRMYRLRKKLLAQGHQSTNQVLYTPPTPNSPMTFGSSPLLVTAVVPPLRTSFYESDDDDDTPLSKMIGHPNDDQLRALVAKIVKESKLEDITMKHVIRRVFDTYPNYDLSYRKEFIKSIVRQILSQMDDQTCSVTTTVITI